jgi:hypothetical protein
MTEGIIFICHLLGGASLNEVQSDCNGVKAYEVSSVTESPSALDLKGPAF